MFTRANRRSLKAMSVTPVDQEKRQPGALIDKENFVRRGLLLNNLADPVLTKQKKIELQMNNITPQAPIETNNVYGWKRRAELLKKGPVETSPDGG